MTLHIGFFGAGAIGGYLGVRLSAAGFPVTLVGRQALVDARPDFVAVDLAGTEHQPTATLTVSDSAAALAPVDVCFVTTKSAGTREAGHQLRNLPAQTKVISLQNGLHNAEVLSEALGRPAIAGMITYNVRRESTGRFRKATSGPIMIGREAGEELAAAFEKTGEPVTLREDMPAVLLTKLLMNLNNGPCAITGTSFLESLRDRKLRRAYAACMSEGLEIVRAAKRPITRLGPLAPPLVARLLPLPDFIFVRLARRMMQIDPAARASTLQDLEHGKPTEIDYLHGGIAALAKSIGREAPVNRWVTEQVHRLEKAGLPCPFLRADQVWQGIEAARR